MALKTLVPLTAFCLLAMTLGCRSRPVPVADGKESAERFRDHNLILVSFDALQAAHVGILGYDRDVTPTIDSMAREGYTFRNVQSVASWTVPSTMSWFTGVYPSEHRITNKFAVYNSTSQKQANLKDLAPDLVTLADALRENGYATAGFTGNAGVSGGFGYDQGFDVYYYPKGLGTFAGLDRSVPKALEWLRANKEKKFFLFLHGYDVHGQNTPAGGFDYRFVEKDYDMRYTGSEAEQEALREEGLEKRQLKLRDADVRFWRAIYDEKIQRADARFAHFLKEFDKLGIGDKTLFVLTSDHGTEVYEHRRFDHGFTLYNEQTHVPLIVKPPGRSGGKTISDRVSSIDFMPTILDLLDAKGSPRVKKQMRGRSLVPALRGERVATDAFAETDYREYTFKRSITTADGWKFIYTLESRSRELYDLNADPKEMKNLATTDPERADELQRRLFAHFASIGHDLMNRTWEVGLNPVYPSQGRKK